MQPKAEIQWFKNLQMNITFNSNKIYMSVDKNHTVKQLAEAMIKGLENLLVLHQGILNLESFMSQRLSTSW